MGFNQRLLFKIILLILFFIIIVSSVIGLYKFIEYEILDYYDEKIYGDFSETISESKERGVFLWEYEMEYINTSDTLCLQPNYAFAEWRWYSNDKNPDSLLVDSTESFWQAVINIPQLKDIRRDYCYIWDVFENESQGSHFTHLKDSTIAVIYSNSRHPIPVKDTLKYYLCYHLYKDSNDSVRYKDTLTLYLTRKYKAEDQ